MIKIIPFSEKYLEEMAQLFSETYSDKDGVYRLDLARKRLIDDLKTGKEYSFMAIDEKIVGGIFCKLLWSDTGQDVYIDSVQVRLEMQKNGIGTKLIMAVLNKAKQKGIRTIQACINVTQKHLPIWYKRLGFKKTHWVMYVGEVQDLKP